MEPQSRKIAVVDKAPSGVNYKSYFKFDPNELGISGWKKLGFTEKLNSTKLS